MSNINTGGSLSTGLDMASIPEKDKSDKNKMNNQLKHVPKDAQVIMSIMKEMGVNDYEPRVINQLLEFTYRYVTTIIEYAKIYAALAKKKAIDLDDVKIATEMLLESAYTTPVPRHVLAKLGEQRNAMPLPPIKPHCGLRLPPDRYCLSACNCQLRSAMQPKKMTKSAIENRSNLKSQIKSGNSGGKRSQGSNAKNHVVSVPKPVFKLSAMENSSKEKKKTVDGRNDNKMQMDDDNPMVVGGVTRERQEDDFEIVG